MALVVCIVVVLAVGNIGTMTTIKATHSWYAQIQKPAWTPPDWVFGPVWTTLFVMMAVAASNGRVAQDSGDRAIDSAGECTDGGALADLTPDLVHLP